MLDRKVQWLRLPVMRKKRVLVGCLFATVLFLLYQGLFLSVLNAETAPRSRPHPKDIVQKTALWKKTIDTHKHSAQSVSAFVRPKDSSKFASLQSVDAREKNKGVVDIKYTLDQQVNIKDGQQVSQRRGWTYNPASGVVTGQHTVENKYVKIVNNGEKKRDASEYQPGLNIAHKDKILVRPKQQRKRHGNEINIVNAILKKKKQSFELKEVIVGHANDKNKPVVNNINANALGHINAKGNDEALKKSAIDSTLIGASGSDSVLIGVGGSVHIAGAASGDLRAGSTNTTFICVSSGVVLPMWKLNDNYCDCPDDGSDEPLTNACAAATFTCGGGGSGGGDKANQQYLINRARRYSTRHNKLRNHQTKLGESIPSGFVNDGVCDCCDGSDEWAHRNTTEGEQVLCVNVCHENI